MISKLLLVVIFLASRAPDSFVLAAAQQQGGGTTQGRRFITVVKYTPEEDERILKLYEGLRVADVSDGMDMAGLQDVGLMDPDIKPLWRDVEGFQRDSWIGCHCALRSNQQTSRRNERCRVQAMGGTLVSRDIA